MRRRRARRASDRARPGSHNSKSSFFGWFGSGSRGGPARIQRMNDGPSPRPMRYRVFPISVRFRSSQYATAPEFRSLQERREVSAAWRSRRSPPHVAPRPRPRRSHLCATPRAEVRAVELLRARGPRASICDAQRRCAAKSARTIVVRGRDHCDKRPDAWERWWTLRDVVHGARYLVQKLLPYPGRPAKTRVTQRDRGKRWIKQSSSG